MQSLYETHRKPLKQNTFTLHKQPPLSRGNIRIRSHGFCGGWDCVHVEVKWLRTIQLTANAPVAFKLKCNNALHIHVYRLFHCCNNVSDWTGLCYGKAGLSWKISTVGRYLRNLVNKLEFRNSYVGRLSLCTRTTPWLSSSCGRQWKSSYALALNFEWF